MALNLWKIFLMEISSAKGLIKFDKREKSCSVEPGWKWWIPGHSVYVRCVHCRGLHCRAGCSRTPAGGKRSWTRWRRRWRAWRRRFRPCWTTLCPADIRSNGRSSCETEWREDWWWCPGSVPRTWTACLPV